MVPECALLASQKALALAVQATPRQRLPRGAVGGIHGPCGFCKLTLHLLGVLFLMWKTSPECHCLEVTKSEGWEGGGWGGRDGNTNKKPKWHWVPEPLSSSAFVPHGPRPMSTATAHAHGPLSQPVPTAHGPQPRPTVHCPYSDKPLLPQFPDI